MTDYFQDRIKLNPKLDIKESAGSVPGQTGSLDSGRSGDSTGASSDVTVAKEKAAPKNNPSTWSADSPY